MQLETRPPGASPASIFHKICGASALGLGVAVGVGWLLGIDTLKSVLPGHQTMKPATALMFAAAGFALMRSSTRAERSQDHQGLAWASAVLVLLIAGISSALKLVESSALHPAWSTLTAFFAVGIALLRRRSASNAALNLPIALWTTALVIGVAAFAGQLIDAANLRTIPFYETMAVHTALGLVVLCAGGLVLESRQPAGGLLRSTIVSEAAPRYIAAVLIVLWFTWLRFVLVEVVELRHAYVILYPAVLLAALLLGRNAGLLATGFAALVVNVAFIEPVGTISLSAGDLVGWLVFVATGIAVSLVAGALHRLYAVEASVRGRLEQRVAERTEELVHAAQRGDIAQLAAKAFFYEFRPATGEVTGNENVRSVLGYGDGDMPRCGDDWRRIIHPDDVASAWATIEAGLRSGDGFELEYRVRHRSGHFIWIYDRARIIRERSGNVRVVGMVIDITEAKRTEQALRESEKHAKQQVGEIEAIYASARVGLCVLDRELRYVRINDRLAEINGVPVRDHIGRTVRDVVPALADLVDNVAQRIFATGQAVTDLELSGRTSASEELRTWIEQWIPIKNENGETVAINVSVEEITERKRTEQALRESEERINLAQSAAQIGIWDWNIATGKTGFNTVYYDLFGLPHGTQHGFNDFLALVHPEDRDDVDAAMRRALSGDAPYKIKYRIIRADNGEMRWLEASGQATFDELGQAQRIMGAVLDITVRKAAEEALRAREAEFRAMFEVSNVGKAQADPATRRLVRANQGLADITGYSVAELEGMPIDQLNHPGDNERDGAVFGQFARGEAEGDRYSIEKRYVRKDGRPIWVRVNASLIRDGDGRPVSTAAVIEDITLRKNIEEALVESQRFSQGLVDAAPSLLYIFDLEEGRNSYISPQIETMLGYGMDEIRGMGTAMLTELLHPEDVERVGHHHQALIDRVEGEPLEIEYRMRHKDGTWRWLASRDIVYRRDAAGHAVAILGSALDITERKEDEEELKESEGRIRRILGTSPAGIVEANAEGRMTLVNPRWCEMLGYTEAELRAMSVFDVTAPESREPTREAVARLAAGGPDFEIEKNYVRRDGSVMYAISSVSALRSESGAFAGLVAIVIDISDRRRAEESLRTAEAKFRGTFETAAVGMAHVGLDGRWLEVNECLSVITGYSREELLAGTYWDITLEDDKAADVENTRRLLAAEVATLTFDKRFVRKNGSIVWAGVTVAAQRDGKGEPEYFIVVIRDVSKRVRAQEELRESEARFRLLADSAPVLIWVNTPEGNEFVNRAYLEFVGVGSSEALKGYDWTRFVHPDDKVDYVTAYRDCLAKRSYFEATFRFRRADGEYRWMKSAAAPRFSETGELLGFVGSTFDITDVKHAEEQIRLLMREVNHRSKNLLTVVQSIARQTAKDTSPQDFAGQFSQRLQGLAASQDLIVLGNWSGVTVGDLVRSQLGHLGETLRTRAELEGERVVVTPSAAQGIGMALHELATNAIKYGALSNETGRIHVGWAVTRNADGPRFVMTWRERGGPPVEPPRRRGFGHIVTERMAALAVGGTVDLAYDREGLTWRLEAPADQVLFFSIKS